MTSFANIQFWDRALDRAVDWILSSGPSIVIILIVGLASMRIATYLLIRLSRVLIARAKDLTDFSFNTEQRIVTLALILRSLVRVLIGAVVVMWLLKEFGVDIAPILAGAGVAGLAVGFGAQNLVRDVISGFFMLLENQIRVGDVAIINGTGGLVESVNLRTTTLRDLSGVVHVFPNGTINTLSNMTKGWSGAVFDIGVAYKEDVDRVIDVIKATADDLQKDPAFGPEILEPLEVFGLDKFADSALVIRARFKTKPIKQWFVGREFNRRLKRAFDAHGIEIPFPQRTLHFATDSSKLAALAKDTA